LSIIKADVCIIGCGVIGLSTAYQISIFYPDKYIVLLEKEPGPAYHQTGHNSGVIHSGIYYKPGSLKSVNCREGKLSLEKFCLDEGIEHEICGKVIVAIDGKEIPGLENIYHRGQSNGVACKLICRNELRDLEPHVNGVKAIHVPETGIVNYRQVCDRFIHRIKETGNNELYFNSKVKSILPDNGKFRIITGPNEIQARNVINCAGLYSDRITRVGGQKPSVKIIPFRGEYFQLKQSAHFLCKNLIYPVPDPKYPFLGVHFTRMIDGSVECGPNAVLAYAREGYTKSKINPFDLFESLTYPGFIKMAFKFRQIGAAEMWRSISKKAFVRDLQRLVPEIQSDHLITAPSGVRAQAVSRDGTMIDDFMIQANSGIINVCNAPSPAATSSLSIGKHILTYLKHIW
jgi:L-2-hydroxyglutarate oxidase